MRKLLKFTVNDVEVLEDNYNKAKENRFAKVKIKCFGDGENAHTHDVSLESLQKSADSIYDIPLICELNPYRGGQDFGGHGTLTGKQFSFGFIKEEKNNPIAFEYDKETGQTFLTIIGTIWKKYSANVLDILKNKQNTEVSVELTCIQGKEDSNKKISMDRWVFDAITFLGNITASAYPNAQAQLQFSKDKEKYFSENSIKINNSKESVIDGSWVNPRGKLLNPINKASNKQFLLEEAYLIVDDSKDSETSLSEVHYPHHYIKNNELVLHISGVQSAFSRASAQNIVEGDIKSHLLRHYKELGLNQENFASFGMDEKTFQKYFASEFRKEEAMTENFSLTSEQIRDILQRALAKNVIEVEGGTQQGFWVRDHDEQYVYVYDYKDCGLARFTYTINENNEAEIDYESKTEVLTDYKPLTDEETTFCQEYATQTFSETSNSEEEEEKIEEEEDKKDEEDGEEKLEEETHMSEDENKEEDEEEEEDEKDEETFESLQLKYETLKAENLTYVTKIEEMSDYEELKQFKIEFEIKSKQEQEMFEMTQVISQLETKGISFDDNSKQELFEQRKNFENISAWSNYVKANALDRFETTDNIIKMQIPNSDNDRTDTSYNGVWASLKNKLI